LLRAYPEETAEAFCDGHNAAFGFSARLAEYPRALAHPVAQESHYVFADRFGRPGKGNDKGKVEGLVGGIRRNLLVPVPRATSLDALNDALGGALLGELVVFAQERRQLDRLEVMGEQQLRRVAHDEAPASRVPRSILYDNTRLAVARIRAGWCPGGHRPRRHRL
jgi:hypothetical protein